MSVKEADEMIRIRDQIIKEFKGVKKSKQGLYNKYKKEEQPVIDAINNLGDKLEKVIEHEHEMALVPIAQTTTISTQTPIPTTAPISTQTPVKMITNYRTSSLGPVVTKYLNTRNDDIWHSRYY